MDRVVYQTVLKGDVEAFRKLTAEYETQVKQSLFGASNSVLHLAARFGHLPLVVEILNTWPEMGVAENEELETALHEACREGHVEMMGVLMDKDEGVVCKVNRRGESVLLVASERGKVQVVKKLVEYQWLLMHELDAVTCSVHVAAAAGYTEIVKEIVKVRPEFASKRTSQGYTPLHLACSKGHLDLTRELLSLDPDLSYFQDNEGWTPLHWASMKGRIGIIDELLSGSLECIEMVSNHAETVLHLAAKNNQFDTLKYLMEKFNITKLLNAQDNDGNTVLHLATSGKLTAMVIYLLKLGVDVNAVNCEGKTALDVVESDASNSGALAIVPALQEAGAKRCDQLPPISRDIPQVLIQPSSGTHSPWTKKHLDSPVKPHHHRNQSGRRAKQIELQNEGLRNARNTITIVAVLIATVTFTGGINPPGGYNQTTGKAIMGTKTPFKVFMVCNVMALFLSLGIVNVLVSVIPYRRKSMMKLLIATHKVLWISTVFMASAYIAGAWTILPEAPRSRWLTFEVVSVGVGCTFVVLLGLGILLAKHWTRKQEWRRRKDRKNKDRTPNSSVNSRVGEMHFIKNSRVSSSNSDVDSSDHGYHVY